MFPFTRVPFWVPVFKPMVPFRGRCTTHFRLNFSGDWDVDVHGGYDLDFAPWPDGSGRGLAACLLAGWLWGHLAVWLLAYFLACLPAGLLACLLAGSIVCSRVCFLLFVWLCVCLLACLLACLFVCLFVCFLLL